NNKQSLTYNDQSAFLTQLKKENDTSWLKEINSQSLQYSLKCLENAYQGFFNKRTQFPKFKSKKSKNSFTCPQFVSVENNSLNIPKIKGIKMTMERKIEGKIKKATITKTPSGKYFVSILTEKIYKSVNKTNKSIGIDLGIKDFLVLSNGTKIKNHRFLKLYERLLSKHQQHLSRKQKGSNRYEKQRLKVAKIHEKISNSRMDLIHKTTLNLVKEFDTIYLEDLNVKGMMKNHKLSKAISDVSWGKFIETLTYKAEWNDKEVVHIDRFFPSSKTCHLCGYINHNLTLKDRTWKCSECCEVLDRDVNAAINILNEGCRKNMSGGTSDYKRRAKIRPSLEGTGIEAFKEKELI
ncbi:transposase, partial [Candidatus Dojkabacteria bacterium]|nr:transposase [Candidatus Dojkabacteria bacterium]